MIQKFLLWCSGANMAILNQFPDEKSKFTSIGITILFTGIFASLSGGYAFYKIFSSPENNFFQGAIIMGILWGFMIFNLDRYIVMSIKKQDNKLKEFNTAIPRIILAVIISIVVAKPLEIRVFSDRIEAQIFENKLTKLEGDKLRIYDQTGKTGIDSSKNQNDAEITNLTQQLANDCPTPACQTAYKAMKQAQTNYNSIYGSTKQEYYKAKRDINWIQNPKNPSDGIIVDEKKQLDANGLAKLRTARAAKSRIERQRSSARNDYNNKTSTYNKLNNDHKKEVQSKLNVAKEQDEILTEQKIEADSNTYSLEKESKTSSNISFTDNFITQIEALEELTKWKHSKKDSDGNTVEAANNSMFWMNWAIVLLFLVIETAPLFVKLITPKGLYDIALQANNKLEEMKLQSNNKLEETTLQSEISIKEAQLIHNANTSMALSEQKGQNKLQLALNNQQAQLSTAQIAIQAWQDDKLKQLNNGQLTDDEYKVILKQILDFDILTNTNT